MKRLKLRMEDLEVDTFQAAPVLKEKGTVFGEAYTQFQVLTCGNDDTCADTCSGACASASCEYFTCLGWESRWGHDQFCVLC